MSSCPVGYTCPTIDDTISCIRNAVNILERYTDDMHELGVDYDDVSGVIQDLKYLYEKRGSNLEEIRSANAALREWGFAMEQEKRVAEEDNAALMNENFHLTNEIHDLNRELKNAESK